MRSFGRALGAAMILLGWASHAHAGGIEQPDHGASALGRGAAFTARADDGAAVVYNVAGYAQQSGTHAMLSVNVVARSYEFARAGNYPDDPNNPLTPWGGKPFPVVKGQGAALPLPTLSLSSDFGLERWTFFGALLVPSAAGGGSYPLGVDDGVPNPARYMATTQKGIVALPTLGVATRVLDWLDVGVGGHLVVGSVDTYAVSSFDTSKKTCPNQEFEPCDAISHLNVSGKAFAASIGALARLTHNITAGANFRSGYSLSMDGTVTPQPPKTLGGNAETVPIQVGVSFPWVLRTGVRYAGYEADKEKFDVEADFVYEAWSTASVQRAFIPKAAFLENVDASVDNGFSDCFSVRLGGSYHASDLLTLRAGLFHETSSLPEPKTRAGAAGGFAKTGLTGGVGLSFGAVTLNAAYAAVLSPTRDVTDGDLRPGNAARGGQPLDSSDGNGKLYDAMNNGRHSTMAHVFSLGIEVAFGAAPKPQLAIGEAPPPPAPKKSEPEADAAKSDAPADAPKPDASKPDASPKSDPPKSDPPKSDPPKADPPKSDAPPALTPDSTSTDEEPPAPKPKPKPKTKKKKPKAKITSAR